MLGVNLALNQNIKQETLVKAVFWDRDGVLVEVIDEPNWGIRPPWTIEEFRFKPDAKLSIDLVKGRGFKSYVVTNQSDIEIGKLQESTLHYFNKMLKNWLHIDDVRYASSKSSPYYKPGNRMIEDLISIHNVDREKSWLVGDRWKDIVAGKRSGLKTIWIDNGEGEITPEHFSHHKADYTVNSAYEAAQLIIGLENVN